MSEKKKRNQNASRKNKCLAITMNNIKGFHLFILFFLSMPGRVTERYYSTRNHLLELTALPVIFDKAKKNGRDHEFLIQTSVYYFFWNHCLSMDLKIRAKN